MLLTVGLQASSINMTIQLHLTKSCCQHPCCHNRFRDIDLSFAKVRKLTGDITMTPTSNPNKPNFPFHAGVINKSTGKRQQHQQHSPDILTIGVFNIYILA